MPWGEFEPATLEALRSLLDRADYRVTQRLPAFPCRSVQPLRELATLARYLRGTLPPLRLSAFRAGYWRHLERRSPRALELYRLFFLHQEIAFRDELAPLVEAGLLEGRDRVRSLVQVAVVHDRYVLSSVAGRSPGEYVYLGDDSARLCGLVRELPPRGRALDLCCGCGVVSLTLPAGYSEVVGLDLNPNAVALARSNALLNRVKARFLESDMWEAAEGRFDLVVGNPPALPLESSDPDLRFAAGGPGLTLRAVEGLEEHLAADGRCLLLTFSSGELYDAVADRLGGDFSLDYRVEQVFLGGKLEHVLLEIRRDGTGTRRRHPLSAGRRLSGLTLPFWRPAASDRYLP